MSLRCAQQVSSFIEICLKRKKVEILSKLLVCCSVWAGISFTENRHTSRLFTVTTTSTISCLICLTPLFEMTPSLNINVYFYLVVNTYLLIKCIGWTALNVFLSISTLKWLNVRWKSFKFSVLLIRKPSKNNPKFLFTLEILSFVLLVGNKPGTLLSILIVYLFHCCLDLSPDKVPI